MTNPTTITDDADTKYTLTTGLVAKDSEHDAAKCSDCGRWAYAGESIRHSTRCNTPTLQAGGHTSATKHSARIRPVTRRRRCCDECGYTVGHRMDCALLAD